MASLAEKSNKPLDPTKVFASGKALRTIATDAGTVQFTIQTYRGPKAPGKDKFDVAFDPPLGEVTIVDKADGSHTVTAVVPADAEAGMKTITITVAGTGVGIKGSPYHTMVEAGAHGQLREVFRKYDTDGSGQIDAKEFQSLVQSLGEKFTDEEAKEALAVIDSDSSGAVDFSEFLGWWTSEQHSGASSTEKQIRLQAIKLKLQAENATMMAVKVLGGAASDSKPSLVSIKAGIKAGDCDTAEEHHLHTGLDVTAEPSNQATFNRALDGYNLTGEEGGNSVIALEMLLLEDVSEEDAEALREKVATLLASPGVTGALPGMKLSVTVDQIDATMGRLCLRIMVIQQEDMHAFIYSKAGMDPTTQSVFDYLSLQVNMKECIPDAVERPGATVGDLMASSAQINCRMNKAVLKQLAEGGRKGLPNFIAGPLAFLSVMKNMDMDMHFDSVQELISDPLFRSIASSSVIRQMERNFSYPLFRIFPDLDGIAQVARCHMDNIAPGVYKAVVDSVESLHALKYDTPTLAVSVRFLNLGIVKCLQSSSMLSQSQASMHGFPTSVSCSGCGKEFLNGAYKQSGLCYYARPSYFLKSSGGMATIRWSEGGKSEWETEGKHAWVLCFLDDKRKYMGVQAQYAGTCEEGNVWPTKASWAVKARGSTGTPVVS